MLVVVRLGKGIRLMTRQPWQYICQYCGDLSGSHSCNGISITRIRFVDYNYRDSRYLNILEG